MLGHERDLFQVDQLAFSVLRAALSLRGFNRHRPQLPRADGPWMPSRSRPGGRMISAGGAWSRSDRGKFSRCMAVLLVVKDLFQDAVYDQVRISPDGRSEVGIGACGQGKVAEVFLRIAGLFERAQHEVGKNALLGLAFDAPGQTLVMPRRDFEINCFQLLVEPPVLLALDSAVDADALPRR